MIYHDFYVITFECIALFSSLPKNEIKLVAIVNWIFYVPDRLFMPFKYRLILLWYSITVIPKIAYPH